MEKTRVKTLKKYWFIISNATGTTFYADWERDVDTTANIKHFESGNYSHTREEAEAMARKLRAVLNGADVIEMPSEEEIESVASKICHEIEKYGIVSGHSISGYMTSACKSMADFFNNKIVK